jgi:hypothetical protein
MGLWMWELKKIAGSKNIGEIVWELSRVKIQRAKWRAVFYVHESIRNFDCLFCVLS